MSDALSVAFKIFNNNPMSEVVVVFLVWSKKKKEKITSLIFRRVQQFAEST